MFIFVFENEFVIFRFWQFSVSFSLTKITQRLRKKVVVLCVLQLNTKKRFVYGAIAFIWIVVPTFVTTVVIVSTDIVEGRCIAYGVNQSAAVKKSLGFFMNFVAYFLPLALMVFCYARIIHTLRTKVSYNILPCLTLSCLKESQSSRGAEGVGSGLIRKSPPLSLLILM